MVEVWSVNGFGLVAVQALQWAGVPTNYVVWRQDRPDAADPAEADVVVTEPPSVPLAKVSRLLVCGWPKLVDHTMLGGKVVGFHPTPLPVGRGRSPLPNTLLRGMTESEVCLFRITAGIDDGPVIRREPFKVPKKIDSLVSVVQEKLFLLVAGWALHGLSTEGEPQQEELATYWELQPPAAWDQFR